MRLPFLRSSPETRSTSKTPKRTILPAELASGVAMAPKFIIGTGGSQVAGRGWQVLGFRSWVLGLGSWVFGLSSIGFRVSFFLNLGFEFCVTALIVRQMARVPRPETCHLPPET